MLAIKWNRLNIAIKELEIIKAQREEDCIKKEELNKLRLNTTDLNKFFNYLKKQLNVNIQTIEIGHISELEKKLSVKLLPERVSSIDLSKIDNSAYTQMVQLQEKITNDEKQLYDPLESALIDKREEFINLFLKNGIDIEKFLTAERLSNLYNNQNKVID